MNYTKEEWIKVMEALALFHADEYFSIYALAKTANIGGKKVLAMLQDMAKGDGPIHILLSVLDRGDVLFYQIPPFDRDQIAALLLLAKAENSIMAALAMADEIRSNNPIVGVMGDMFLSVHGDKYRLGIGPVVTPWASFLEFRQITGAFLREHAYGRGGLS